VDPQQLLARLGALTSALSGRQLASLAGAFVLVVGIVAGSAYWVNRPTYALLFADMEVEDAGMMVTRIKALKVPYQLDPGGRSIRVPVERVDELRLELSSQGMPSSGRVGFEIFDRTAFGATEFLEQVNYRRALEGEIARTIATISEVSNARVHIAMGRETLFGDPRPAKASVVLKLRGARGLSAGTISGITNLVAASVEGLRPEAVVVLDSFGRPLAKPGEKNDDPLGAAQLEKQQRIEREMSARVVALLEPVVGVERVRVNVAVKLNPQSQEETEERWDPNTVLRSHQTTSDTSVAGSAASVGSTSTLTPVAGARGNLPISATAAANGATSVTNSTGPSSTRTAETSNFEVSRTTRRTIMPPGDVQRLSVAVILDDNQQATTGQDGTVTTKTVPRTPEHLQKIQELVAASVGHEPDRGDQLTVQNVSFEEAAPALPEAPKTVVQRVQEYTPQIWEGVRMVVIMVIALVALLFVVRPMLKTAATLTVATPVTAGAPTAVLPPGHAPRTVADLESEIEARLDAAAAQGAEGRRLPVLTKRVTAISDSEPENVAKLLRGWIAEGER
jgi:flagellar M-ring protein FliF